MRKWLMPFSRLYGAGVWVHNKMFDLQIKKSVEFELPVISVGNLSTGGTGKTPHVEYLVNLLSSAYPVGVMSRGYRRRTSGYFLVEESSTAHQAGDEPLQVKRKFPRTTVAVCEERALGIPIMLLDDPQLEVIVLDDAFQHRRVKPALSILLTEYSQPFSKDFLLPAGNLREPKQNASRADMIVVTKCPDKISSQEKTQLINELKQKDNQEVFFSSLRYAEPYSLFEQEKKIDLAKIDSALLVTGIASPRSLLHYVQSNTLRDLNYMLKKFQTGSQLNKIILTTEKDGMRLLPFREFFGSHQLEITCIPIEILFLDEEKEKFDFRVLNFVEEKINEYNS
jgi:tetraacyldisaccharide 4'-kinase